MIKSVKNEQKNYSFGLKIYNYKYQKFKFCKTECKTIMKLKKNFENLKNHILPLSENKIDFQEAKKEWKLHRIVKTEKFGKCPCSKEIKEHCYIKNKHNGNITHVGNVCLRQFMDINTNILFSGLKRIQTNNKAKPNVSLIEYAKNMGYLYGDNEYKFLYSIKGKRELSEKQVQWLLFINRRILKAIVVNSLPEDVSYISSNMN